MNIWIDIGLIACAVGALAAGWPFLRNLAEALQDAEDEYIARQLEEARVWDEERADYNIHKHL